jgi:hypothetical protein
MAGLDIAQGAACLSGRGPCRMSFELRVLLVCGMPLHDAYGGSCDLCVCMCAGVSRVVAFIPAVVSGAWRRAALMLLDVRGRAMSGFWQHSFYQYATLTRGLSSRRSSA